MPSRTLLVAHRDKDTITQNSGVTYRYTCDRVECVEEYTGGSHLSGIFCELENLSILSVIWLVSTDLH